MDGSIMSELESIGFSSNSSIGAFDKTPALIQVNNSLPDPTLQALEVPCEERSKKDLKLICDFVKSLKFFYSFSSYPETVEQVAKKLVLHKFTTGTKIFDEGDPGDHFFIILDGEVAIMKMKKFHALVDIIVENVLLVKLNTGQYFGEAALENKDGLRTASAVAVKPCNLLALHRDDYQVILSHFKELLRVAARNCLLAPTSIFNHLPDETINILAQATIMRTYTPNGIIYQEGSKLSTIMILKSGLVKLTKYVPKEDIDDSIQKAKAQLKLPKINSPNKPKPKPKPKPTKLPPKFRKHFGAVNVIDTPPGYWILNRSEDYIATSKPIKTFDQYGSSNKNAIETENRVELTVSVIMPGQVIGEISLLDPEFPSPVSAVASTTAEIFCIDSELFFKLGIAKDQYIMKFLLDDWKFRNPPTSEIKKKFQKKFEWEFQKEEIMNDIKLQNRLKKNY